MPRKETERLASIEKRIEQLTAQKEDILQRQKDKDEKARNHRLCERMGLFENMLPDTILLTKEEFITFLKRTTANDYGRKILDEMKPKEVSKPAETQDKTPTKKSEPATPKPPAGTVPPNGDTSGEKPVEAAEQSSATINGNSPESTSVTG